MKKVRAGGPGAGLGCSGTLISDDLFLTAGHCPVDVGEAVRFNFQKTASGSDEPTQQFAISQIVERKCSQADGCSGSQLSEDLDYAILRLSGNPGRIFGYARLASRSPRIGERVTLIQHTLGVQKVIHSALTVSRTGLHANWFAYVIDTNQKSSGSGVLDVNGYLIGLHTDGIGPGLICSSADPNRGMRISALVSASATLQALLAAQSGALGWTFHHDLAPVTYTPTSAFQFNSTGASNTVTRTATGVYEVKFTGLVTSDPAGGAGGNVQVSAFGTGGYCKVSSWVHVGSDVVARVSCFSTAGVAKNHQFLSLFQGGTITITRQGTGRYTVRFPISGVTITKNMPLVTAAGSLGNQCVVLSWSRAATQTNVQVSCFNAAGSATDTTFTITDFTSTVHVP